MGIAATGQGQGQLRNARSLDYTQLEREENALDIAEFYWRFDAEAPLEQLDSNFAGESNGGRGQRVVTLDLLKPDVLINRIAFS